MLLRRKSNKHMISITNVSELMDLNFTNVEGKDQTGEEEQDSETYLKSDLVFLSGEELPRCWIDPHYRDQELTH